jgi:hypothetical protein
MYHVSMYSFIVYIFQQKINKNRGAFMIQCINNYQNWNLVDDRCHQEIKGVSYLFQSDNLIPYTIFVESRFESNRNDL